jgi:dTDP-4-amino-4,6-dideoxygalactose transaminase
MIKFHIERNIKMFEIPRILFSRLDLKKSISSLYPHKEITKTNYGRTALQLILDKYKLKNCKIIVPAYTCPVFYDIFKRNNIEPILVDVNLKTFNLDQHELKKCINPSIKAIITVDVNGLPCEIEKIKKIAKKTFIIEDCAHSLGATHNGKQVGLTGNASFFSLYKNLPTIKGGFSLTKDQLSNLEKEREFLKMLLKLIYYTNKNANLYRSIKKDNYEYEKDLVYDNIRSKSPNQLVENIGSMYIKRLPQIIKRRRKIAKTIIKNLSNLDLMFQEDKKREHIYTYFSFLLPNDIKEKRLLLLKILKNEGIICRMVWDKPLSSLINCKCPNSKEISERIITIPINPDYKRRDIKKISNIIRSSIERIKQ